MDDVEMVEDINWLTARVICNHCRAILGIVNLRDNLQSPFRDDVQIQAQCLFDHHQSVCERRKRESIDSLEGD
jgi:hypothetical protein